MGARQALGPAGDPAGTASAVAAATGEAETEAELASSAGGLRRLSPCWCGGAGLRGGQERPMMCPRNVLERGWPNGVIFSTKEKRSPKTGSASPLLTQSRHLTLPGSGGRPKISETRGGHRSGAGQPRGHRTWSPGSGLRPSSCILQFTVVRLSSPTLKWASCAHHSIPVNGIRTG